MTGYMKKASFLLVAAVFFMSAVTAADAKVLSGVVARTQEKNLWCWAACTEMVLKYRQRHFADQCEIVELARRLDPGRFGTTTCCLNPDQGCSNNTVACCNRTNWTHGGGNGNMQNLLDHHGIPTTGYNSSLTYATSKSHIDAGNMFVTQWNWINSLGQVTGGHVVIVYGYLDATTTPTVQPNRLNIVDPWPGEGVQVRTYASVTNPPGGVWARTLTTAAPASPYAKLYQHVDYGGSYTTLSGATSYVGDYFNDITSSAKVRGVPWIFYQHINYGGFGYAWGTTPGDYSSYTQWNGLNDEISSVRPTPGWSKYGAIILFEHHYFQGNYTVLTFDSPDLTTYNLNKKVSSAIVIGNIWRLYQNTSYGGYHYALTSFGGPNRDGFYPTPADWGGSDNEASSAYWIPYSWNPILLYQKADMRGRAVALTPYDNSNWLNNLYYLGFNDLVRSIKTFGGTWTIYQHSYLAGPSRTLNANTWYRTYNDWGGMWDLTSLRYTNSGDWF